jgi:Flp pilus assembly pilin Flp
MTRRRRNSLRSTHGQTMTEYAVLLVLVFSVVMGILPFFASSVLRLFGSVADAFGG